MRAAFESVGSSTHASFLVRQFTEKSFSAPYHFHPEYELTLIVQGSGKRYVGAHMCDYFPGDLVLLGANIPHCWKTTPDADDKDSVSVVVHFRHAFLGENFFARPELRSIERLLVNSRYGIYFKQVSVPLAASLQSLVTKEDGLDKLLSLLDILHTLASWPDYTLLDRQDIFPALSDPEKERMNAVMSYVVDNFRTELSLQRAAAIANMTHYSFCRYFRRINRRSFMQVVIDYRIDFAMQQLIYSDKSISQIAFDSGFNDISNFHKTFKSRLKLSPLNYRKQFATLASPSPDNPFPAHFSQI